MTLYIRLALGAALGMTVMALFNANAYDRGQRDILIALARRRDRLENAADWMPQA